MKLGLLAAGWLCGIFIGLQTDAAFLPVALLLMAALAGGVLLLFSRSSLWPTLLAVALRLALLRVGAAGNGWKKRACRLLRKRIV